jgi:hypothetical protein
VTASPGYHQRPRQHLGCTSRARVGPHFKVWRETIDDSLTIPDLDQSPKVITGALETENA